MENFKLVQSEGLDHLKDGHWKDSKRKFEECLKIRGGDGPSAFLIDQMSEQSGGLFMRPDKWAGFRKYDDSKK